MKTVAPRAARRLGLRCALLCCIAIFPGLAAAQAKPALPRATVDTSAAPPSGRTIKVPAGGNLQVALNEAQPGDVIALQAGAAYVGNFLLPRKDGGGWITIRTNTPDADLPPGTRVTPADAPRLAKLESPSVEPILKTAPGAHHYRLVGLEITVPPSVPMQYSMIWFGKSEQNAADVPHHLIVDRCYIHGHPKLEVQRGLMLNSAETAVIDSTIAEIHMVGTETQAIAGWNGPGPFKIANNTLEAAGINVLFGGANPTIPNLVPSDIEIRGNHFVKPLAWKTTDPSYAGTHWLVKNLLEIKAGRRILVDGNLFEYSWTDAQEGWAIRVVLGSDTYAAISDVTFSHNVVRHAAYGLDVCGNCSTATSVVSRVQIFNNLFTDISANRWSTYGGAGWAFMFRNGAQDIIVRHNTVLQTGTFLMMTGAPGARLTLEDNIGNFGPYGVYGDGGTSGSAALDKYFPGWTFEKNILIAPPAGPTGYPAGTVFVASVADVKFTDAERGDYRLARGSRFKDKGKDGKDLGADGETLVLMHGSLLSANR